MQSSRHHIEAGQIDSNLVLVVDDSRLQRSILRASLKKWGYRVAEVSSGDEAMDFCENKQPDLVISDWMMPELNRPDFCRAFRKLYPNDYSYFILLTSKSEKTTLPTDKTAARMIF